MRGWRTRFLFLLIVYFAGFATAIYILAPTPENQAGRPGAKGFLNSCVKSGDFVESFNSGMHKAVDFGKDAARRTAKFLQQKVSQRQSQTRG